MSELSSFSEGQHVPSQQQQSQCQRDQCAERRPWSFCCAFWTALAASLITTAIILLILGLLYSGHFQPKGEAPLNVKAVPAAPVQAACLNINGDTVSLYLNHLRATPGATYPGGTIQCAGFLANASLYPDLAALRFGANIYNLQSGITPCTMTLRHGGLLVPSWNVNANLYGFVIEGTVLIGVVADGAVEDIFRAAADEVFFIPQSHLYWIQNTGDGDAIIVLFYSTNDEIFNININSVFHFIPADVLEQAQLNWLTTPSSANTAEIIILAPEIAGGIPALHSAENYFFSLTGARTIMYAGGSAQWVPTFGGPLTLESLVLNPGALLVPSFTINANEMGYVTSGYGRMGIIGCTVEEFDIGTGDVFFFPAGTQHYIKNTGAGPLTLNIAYSTNNTLAFIFLDDYIRGVENATTVQATVTIQDPNGNTGVLPTDNIEHIVASSSVSVMNCTPGIDMAIILAITLLYHFVFY
ncbi:uncharacterized protein LOC115462892 [Microcaecilia unicolor]|uniref:Uncharacterized protein LOC115462892 n=1 Tax=Microcaecilia unicolor TaxID=1415580 RepID=A0A6P7X8L8_9AMPH|nr:uncharacterized protein LOC115462892 [Microcaecilia unicolor]